MPLVCAPEPCALPAQERQLDVALGSAFWSQVAAGGGGEGESGGSMGEAYSRLLGRSGGGELRRLRAEVLSTRARVDRVLAARFPQSTSLV